MKLIRKVNGIKTVIAILFILTILFAKIVSYADVKRT
jgi:hypothetical protein